MDFLRIPNRLFSRLPPTLEVLRPWDGGADDDTHYEAGGIRAGAATNRGHAGTEAGTDRRRDPGAVEDQVTRVRRGERYASCGSGTVTLVRDDGDDSRAARDARHPVNGQNGASAG